MRIQVTNIRRRSNGTVDMDFYRRKTFLLRREATNQILHRFGRFVRPLIGAVAILVSYALLLPRNPVPQGEYRRYRQRVAMIVPFGRSS
jgi:hypothetical protein